LKVVNNIFDGFTPLSIKYLILHTIVVVFPDPAHAIILQFVSSGALTISSCSAFNDIFVVENVKFL
jgi:hypothetical protein